MRATSMRCWIVRSETYWRPTSAVRLTHASATFQPAASACALAASVARLLPPNMSISHVASNPPVKTSRWSVRPVPHIEDVFSPRSVRATDAPMFSFGMYAA